MCGNVRYGHPTVECALCCTQWYLCRLSFLRSEVSDYHHQIHWNVCSMLRLKPMLVPKSCATFECEPRWEVSEWSVCSTSCGDGVQTRNVNCWKIMRPGLDSTLYHQECNGQDRPVDHRTCFVKRCQAQWNVSSWGQCSNGCGSASVRRRHVTCRDLQCEGVRPTNQEACSLTCVYSWKRSPWSQCSDRCGGHSTRQITCVGNNRTVLKSVTRHSVLIRFRYPIDIVAGWNAQNVANDAVDDVRRSGRRANGARDHRIVFILKMFVFTSFGRALDEAIAVLLVKWQRRFIKLVTYFADALMIWESRWLPLICYVVWTSQRLNSFVNLNHAQPYGQRHHGVRYICTN